MSMLQHLYKTASCICITKGKSKSRNQVKKVSDLPETTRFTEHVNPLHSEPTGSYFRHNFNNLHDLVSQPTTEEMQPTGKGLRVGLRESGTQKHQNQSRRPMQSAENLKTQTRAIQYRHKNPRRSQSLPELHCIFITTLFDIFCLKHRPGDLKLYLKIKSIKSFLTKKDMAFPQHTHTKSI